MRRTLPVALAASLFALLLANNSIADPLPGRDVLKFQQLPMVNTTIPIDGPIVFHGHDELSTAWGVTTPGTNVVTHYDGTFMADDFADSFQSPVVHVKWWGSYINRPVETQVNKFMISFESDVPQSVTGLFSHPGDNLLSQIVNRDTDGVLKPGEGSFTERLLSGGPANEPVYEYNAELYLDKSFPQKPGTVYWLKIVALDQIASTTIPIAQRLQWGWHNRDYTIMNPNAVPGDTLDGTIPIPNGQVPIWHFQDDAVTGTVGISLNPSMLNMPTEVNQSQYAPTFYRAPDDGPSLIATHSKDLAFALYTVPEPGTMMLGLVALIGGVMLGCRRAT